MTVSGLLLVDAENLGLRINALTIHVQTIITHEVKIGRHNLVSCWQHFRVFIRIGLGAHGGACAPWIDAVKADVWIAILCGKNLAHGFRGHLGNGPGVAAHRGRGRPGRSTESGGAAAGRRGMAPGSGDARRGAAGGGRARRLY